MGFTDVSTASAVLGRVRGLGFGFEGLAFTNVSISRAVLGQHGGVGVGARAHVGVLPLARAVFEPGVVRRRRHARLAPCVGVYTFASVEC